MVNELNKPQDNAALSEILAASNRQLEEMQEEHRQLQQELSRLSVQRQQLRQATREQHTQISSSSTVRSSVAVEAEEESVSSIEGASAVQTDAASGENVVAADASNEEEANYLQQKLAEIANLKAQFQRVQQMTDSTKRIEQHISSMESQSQSSTVRQSIQSKSSETVQSSSSTSRSSTSQSQISAQSSESSVESTAQAVPDNAELLNAMINMVTDFTSDLRGQEESLRAERLRIKTLKEEIIQRKQSK